MIRIALLVFIVMAIDEGNLSAVSIGAGSNALLRCRSDDPVLCIWTRNGVHVDIARRYRYLEGDGRRSTNCSIEIVGSPSDLDYGNWSCWRSSDDDGDGRLLNSTAVHPSNATTGEKIDDVVRSRLGENVDIHCEFPDRIYECHWLRNDEPVVITGRYYGTNTKEGTYSTDCSIAISKVRRIDAGFWQCTTATNDRLGYLRAERTRLFVEDANEIVHPSPRRPVVRRHPENVTARVGKTVVLRCEFDEPVRRCGWLRNGQVLQVHYRYDYVDRGTGKNVTNCSVEISNVDHRDFGSWQCCSMADDGRDAVTSDVAWLTDSEMNAPSNVTFRKTPEDVVVALGSIAKVACEFRHEVNCVWLRNGMAVAMEGRYRYAGSEEDGRRTEICSIEIADVKEIDLGRWSCGCSANSESDLTLKSEATISLQIIPSVPEITIDGEIVGELDLVTLDPNSELACRSSGGNPIPELRWEVDGRPLAKVHSWTVVDHGRNGTRIVVSELNLTKHAKELKNYGALSCVATQPDFDVLLWKTINIRKPRIPTAPRILWNDTEIGELDLGSLVVEDSDLRCVSAGGHPPPSLYWEWSGRNVSGKTTLNCDDSACNVTLRWNSTPNAEVWAFPDRIQCVVIHPDLGQPAKSSLTVTESRERSRLDATDGPVHSMTEEAVYSTTTEEAAHSTMTEVPIPPEIRRNGTSVSWMDANRLRVATDLECIAESNGINPPHLQWEWSDGRLVGPSLDAFRDVHGSRIVLPWNTTAARRLPDDATRLDCTAKYEHLGRLLKSSVAIRRGNGTESTSVRGRTDSTKEVRVVAATPSIGVWGVISLTMISIVVALVAGYAIRRRCRNSQKRAVAPPDGAAKKTIRATQV